MTKVLYLIASHSNPEQVIRLVRTLKAGSPECQILIHHDHSSSRLDPAAFESLSQVYILKDYVSVLWGDFSMIEMELHCIRWLMANKIEFDWLVLLSGQDYPIQPVNQIEQFLQNTEYDGFIEYFPSEDPPSTAWNWGKTQGIERYFYRYYKMPSELKPVFYKLYRIVNRDWQPLLRVKSGRFGARLGLRCAVTPFSSDFHCYAGSQWHTLSYRCIEHIHQFVQSHPAFVDHYRHTLIPDESFFQTILLNEDSLKICNENKRYVSWRPPYPAILGVEDFDELVASNKHFARKFDERQDTKILDLLEQHLQTAPSTNVSS
ncbi:beta-1,6-N-acetylglucosaminyltransferase [Leptolyngbya sp. FACHB-261]|uniref:beta-1,6-N-acetylglucosaminyltransferase n=1 Tax=Leptolyngbya sp. FACHB-261 TaxID=2692806 RepID=UPI0016835824|nr:beta-1,6-N-acetylglucosaminyltransferase [Leptolyngbya sp. FACHB-261]MBD2101116.1 hypothetical protein [Leptolyngbya sp. FACHB-261]